MPHHQRLAHQKRRRRRRNSTTDNTKHTHTHTRTERCFHITLSTTFSDTVTNSTPSSCPDTRPPCPATTSSSHDLEARKAGARCGWQRSIGERIGVDVRRAEQREPEERLLEAAAEVVEAHVHALQLEQALQRRDRAVEQVVLDVQR